jgi:BirA family biotin operon repressor/biotin-[acetyl-CoA-carboxylase] ligase
LNLLPKLRQSHLSTNTQPDDWPAGYGRIVLGTTDSTLDEAQRRFAELAGSAWIMAETQSAARGRRGRPWSMPKGNFAATLVIPDNTQSALRSFVAALALYDTFVTLTGRPAAFTLKWPNDVLLNGGKVAGILLEGIQQQQTFAGVAIGFGVNLAAAPDASDVEERALRPVSLAGEFGATITPVEFLDQLAISYAKFEQQHMTQGFAPIRAAWLARASRLGETITARLPNEEITGVFETIDEAGYLVMQTPNERRAIAAADVFF